MKDFCGTNNRFERLDFNGDSGQYKYQSGSHVPRERTATNGFHLIPKGERSTVAYRPCVKYVGKAAIRRVGK